MDATMSRRRATRAINRGKPDDANRSTSFETQPPLRAQPASSATNILTAARTAERLSQARHHCRPTPTAIRKAVLSCHRNSSKKTNEANNRPVHVQTPLQRTQSRPLVTGTRRLKTRNHKQHDERTPTATAGHNSSAKRNKLVKVVVEQEENRRPVIISQTRQRRIWRISIDRWAVRRRQSRRDEMTQHETD